METEQVLAQGELPFCSFSTKEELTSHMESVLSCIKEYEGSKNVVFQRNSSDMIYFLIKKKGSMFSFYYRTLEEVVDKFIELEG